MVGLDWANVLALVNSSGIDHLVPSTSSSMIEYLLKLVAEYSLGNVYLQ